MPTILDNRAGMRLILSSQKRTSTEPAIDELAHIEKQEPAVPDGKIRVSIDGLPTDDEIRLYAIGDSGKPMVAGHAKPAPGAPDPSEIEPNAHFEGKADVPVGTLDIQVHGGVNQTDEAMAGAPVRIVKASAAAKGDFSGAVASKTADNGTVRVAMPATEPLIAMVVINGKEFSTKPFDLSKTGGLLDVEAHWSGTGKLEATFDAPADGKTVYYAETSISIRGDKTIYHQEPFQMVAGRGAHVSLFIFPRLLFQFSLTSQLDDQYLVVGGRFELSNTSWAPYVGGKDGILLPLPKGFGST